MQRVFPTQLRVVSATNNLVEAEESKKGYYDATSKNTLLIGTRANDRIMMSSPGNWYESYVFTLKKDAKEEKPSTKPQVPSEGLTLPEAGSTAEIALRSETKDAVTEAKTVEREGSSNEDDDSLLRLIKKDNLDEFDLWRIVSHVIKTECGRKVLWKQGDKFLTIHGINAAQADKIFHLMEHTLTKHKFKYAITSKWLFSVFSKGNVPDVREKVRKRRKRASVGSAKEVPAKLHVAQPPARPKVKPTYNTWAAVLQSNNGYDDDEY